MESVMAINVLLFPNNPKTMANIAINNSEPIKQIIDKIYNNPFFKRVVADYNYVSDSPIILNKNFWAFPGEILLPAIDFFCEDAIICFYRSSPVPAVLFLRDFDSSELYIRK